MIVTCSCKHTAQDKLHGAGQRVANPVVVPKDTPPKVRCTVCLTVREAKQRA